MTWELGVLMAASLLALQLAMILMRRSLRAELPYVWLLAIDLGFLIFAQVTHRQAAMVGVVASAVAFVLVFGPRLAERVERRAFARDDLMMALRAATLRELLAPGLASSRRRRHTANLVEARSGGAAQVLARLDAELAGARKPDDVTTLLIERATVLFLAGRFRECIDTADKLPGDWPSAHPVLGAYLVRAHADVGELAEAAAVLRTIEQGPTGRDPGALGLLVQARLTLLAFAGRQADVDRLLAGEARTMMTENLRAFLHDTARDHARVDLAPAMGPILDAVAQHAAEAARPIVRPSRPIRVTAALMVANFVAAIVVTRFVPGPEAVRLIRAGALFRPAIESGEWWRAFTAMFLHGGWGHLGVNIYVLFMLGRFCEEVFGPLRYFVIYVVAGLVGFIASTLNTHQIGLSVGASGAIMGLLGAIIVVLIIRRGTWPEAWRKTLLWTLVLLSALQIFTGLLVPIVDNAAHVGGLLGGGATAILIAPGGLLRRSMPVRVLLAAVALASIGLVVFAVVKVATTPLEKTIDKIPTRVINAGGRAWRVPRYWVYDADENVAWDPYLELRLPREDNKPDDPALRRIHDHIEKRAGSP